MRKRRPIPMRFRRGLTLRQVAPNAVTAMALCFGLTGIRYGIAGDWEKAIAAVVFAGVLDGIDGHIARMLKGESRFGAELDSLSDVIAFGVSPAIILYLWSLQAMPRFGWVVALAHALCCALRLARFNAAIDAAAHQPKKAAGFNTGVPAPAGAGLAFVPIYAWFLTDMEIFRDWRVVAPWMALIAFLMISNLPTLGWRRLRLPPEWRLMVIGGAGLFSAMLMLLPWVSLLALSLFYLAMVPVAWMSWARITQRRGGLAADEQGEAPHDHTALDERG
jgi:CDP-diacylglycerol---serine O-phosphatidyltransferase